MTNAEKEEWGNCLLVINELCAELDWEKYVGRTLSAVVGAFAVFIVVLIVLTARPVFGATCQGQPIPCEYCAGIGECYCWNETLNPARRTPFDANAYLKWGHMAVAGGSVIYIDAIVWHNIPIGNGYIIEIFGDGPTEVAARIYSEAFPCQEGWCDIGQWRSPVFAPGIIKWARLMMVRCVGTVCQYSYDVAQSVMCDPPVNPPLPSCYFARSSGWGGTVLLGPLPLWWWRRVRRT